VVDVSGSAGKGGAVLLFILLTDVCNLHCEYCGGFTIEDPKKAEVSYDLDVLVRFMRTHPVVDVEFYGGEPLLRIPLMLKMMDTLPARYFMVQTNATLLHRVPTEYLRRFHTILASIDGPREITDGYRGRGVYDTVVRNVRDAIDRGFSGDMIARMTVSHRSDIYRDVRHLLSLGIFSHVHWQLDAIWGDRWDFGRWAEENYNPGISRLVEEWVEKMRDGVVEGIVPFKAIMTSLVREEKTGLRCGAGLNAFAITPRGEVMACPIAPEFRDMWLGDMDTLLGEKKTIRSISGLLQVGPPCDACEVRDICGGRCLFANRHKLWGTEGEKEVCGTVKHLIRELQKNVEEVRGLLRDGVITREKLFYPETNNGCEIIP